MTRASRVCILATLCVSLAAGLFGGSVGVAQPGCSYFALNSVLVNIRRDPSKPGGYIDVLEKGDVACVTEQRKIADNNWAFIKAKTAPDGSTADVGGWANLRYLEPTGAPGSKRAADKQKAPAEQPFKALPDKTDQAKSKPPADDVFRYDQPVPFGAFPVRGRTLEELAVRMPLFSPIEGLDDALWKRNCTTCHKWNKERLCEQGKSYLKAARHVLRHQHPYGGPYKLALMRWAKSGCQ